MLDGLYIRMKDKCIDRDTLNRGSVQRAYTHIERGCYTERTTHSQIHESPHIYMGGCQNCGPGSVPVGDPKGDHTLPQTNMEPEEVLSLWTTVLCKGLLFRFHVSLGECNFDNHPYEP